MEITYDELPVWVQERMLECQEEQGNKKNPEVFRVNTTYGKNDGGFIWSGTYEGFDGWYAALVLNDYGKIIKSREIIGYILVKPEYERAAMEIANIPNEYWKGFKDGSFLKNNVADYKCYLKKLKEAGILSSWFKPIYKERYKVGDYIICEDAERLNLGAEKITDIINEGFQIDHKKLYHEDYILRRATSREIKESRKPELPKINGYNGKIKDGFIIYGDDCAKLPVEWFKKGNGNRYIKSMVLSSGVKINEDQMNQIRKCLQS